MRTGMSFEYGDVDYHDSVDLPVQRHLCYWGGLGANRASVSRDILGNPTGQPIVAQIDVNPAYGYITPVAKPKIVVPPQTTQNQPQYNPDNVQWTYDNRTGITTDNRGNVVPTPAPIPGNYQYENQAPPSYVPPSPSQTAPVTPTPVTRPVEQSYNWNPFDPANDMWGTGTKTSTPVSTPVAPPVTRPVEQSYNWNPFDPANDMWGTGADNSWLKNTDWTGTGQVPQINPSTGELDPTYAKNLIPSSTVNEQNYRSSMDTYNKQVESFNYQVEQYEKNPDANVFSLLESQKAILATNRAKLESDKLALDNEPWVTGALRRVEQSGLPNPAKMKTLGEDLKTTNTAPMDVWDVLFPMKRGIQSLFNIGEATGVPVVGPILTSSTEIASIGGAYLFSNQAVNVAEHPEIQNPLSKMWFSNSPDPLAYGNPEDIKKQTATFDSTMKFYEKNANPVYKVVTNFMLDPINLVFGVAALKGLKTVDAVSDAARATEAISDLSKGAKTRTAFDSIIDAKSAQQTGGPRGWWDTLFQPKNELKLPPATGEPLTDEAWKILNKQPVEWTSVEFTPPSTSNVRSSSSNNWTLPSNKNVSPDFSTPKTSPKPVDWMQSPEADIRWSTKTVQDLPVNQNPFEFKNPVVSRVKKGSGSQLDLSGGGYEGGGGGGGPLIDARIGGPNSALEWNSGNNNVGRIANRGKGTILSQMEEMFGRIDTPIIEEGRGGFLVKSNKPVTGLAESPVKAPPDVKPWWDDLPEAPEKPLPLDPDIEIVPIKPDDPIRIPEPSHPEPVKPTPRPDDDPFINPVKPLEPFPFINPLPLKPVTPLDPLKVPDPFESPEEIPNPFKNPVEVPDPVKIPDPFDNPIEIPDPIKIPDPFENPDPVPDPDPDPIPDPDPWKTRTTRPDLNFDEDQQLGFNYKLDLKTTFETKFKQDNEFKFKYKPVTDTVTDFIPETRVELTPDVYNPPDDPFKTKKLPPPFWIKQKREKFDENNPPEGTIAWRQGKLNGRDVWKAIYPPYDQDEPVTLKEPPQGATVRTGKKSAYHTAQILKGRFDGVAFVDMGAQDVQFTGEGTTAEIEFNRGGEHTNIGRSNSSPTKGMSVYYKKPPRSISKGVI